MRLLIVTNDFPPKPGGIQQYLGNLVDAYSDPVHIVGPHDPAAEPDTSVTRGTRRYMLPTRSTRALVAGTIREFEPDAVLFGAPHPLAALGPSLRDEFNLPFGVLAHGAEVTIPSAIPGCRQWLGRVLRAADVCFAVSRYTAERVTRISRSEVTRVGAGVDVGAFKPPEWTRANPKPVIGCVGRFVPRKGHERLLEAVAMMDRDVQVLMVGKGRLESRIRERANKLGVDARFEIDVPWSDLGDLYRSMDIFAMPCKSRWGGLEVEGLGLVFLEASATGIPVVAGDSGGSPETVRVGETGFVATEPAEVARHLTTLVDDPDLAAAMGAAGREFVVSEFTWNRVVERFVAGFAPHLR
ncbi:MAG: glycosyltransferase family 4 protein [Acidimicrobiia bacterium]